MSIMMQVFSSSILWSNMSLEDTRMFMNMAILLPGHVNFAFFVYEYIVLLFQLNPFQHTNLQYVFWKKTNKKILESSVLKLHQSASTFWKGYNMLCVGKDWTNWNCGQNHNFQWKSSGFAHLRLSKLVSLYRVAEACTYFFLDDDTIVALQN